MNNPIQPLYTDENGTTRFKANVIVRFLLDAGPIDMNKLAMMEFSADDRMQFAQLIGYSLSGYSELFYVSDDAFGIAAHMRDNPNESQDKATAEYMTQELHDLRDALREPMARLFGVHPDDLGGRE